MNDYNKIEEKMKSISGSEELTPPAMIWDHIESELDEPKRKRRLFIWLCLGLLGTAVAYMTITTFSTQNIIAEEIKLQQDVPSQSKNQSSTYQNENAAKTDLSVKSLGTTQTQIATSNQIKNINNKSQSDNIINDRNLENFPEITFSEKSQTKILPEYKQTFNEYLSTTNTNSQNLDLDITSVDLDQSLLNIPYIKVLQLYPLSSKSTPKSSEVLCPNFNDSKNINFFAEINLLTGTHIKNLSSAQPSTLADERNNTESPFLGLGLSIAGGVHLSDHIYLLTGIEWYRATEKFSRTKEGLTKIIIDYDIETNEAIDTSFVTGTLSDEGMISYNMINIPLSIGYRNQLGAWSYGAEVGGILNLAFDAKGKVVTQNGTISQLENIEPVYKDQLGLGFKSSLVIGRSLQNGLSLQSRLSFSKYLKEVNDMSYDLDTNLNLIRLEIGVKKEF